VIDRVLKLELAATSLAVLLLLAEITNLAPRFAQDWMITRSSAWD